MFKPLMFSLTALSLSFAHGASAAEYTILMEEGAFYPEITHLAPGDIVTFKNNNTSSIEALASDASWTTGSLAAGSSFDLPITPETALTFAFASDSSISGFFSFDLAPLSEVEGSGTVDPDGFTPEATN